MLCVLYCKWRNERILNESHSNRRGIEHSGNSHIDDEECQSLAAGSRRGHYHVASTSHNLAVHHLCTRHDVITINYVSGNEHGSSLSDRLNLDKSSFAMTANSSTTLPYTPSPQQYRMVLQRDETQQSSGSSNSSGSNVLFQHSIPIQSTLTTASASASAHIPSLPSDAVLIAERGRNTDNDIQFAPNAIPHSDDEIVDMDRMQMPTTIGDEMDIPLDRISIMTADPDPDPTQPPTLQSASGGTFRLKVISEIVCEGESLSVPPSRRCQLTRSRNNGFVF